MVLVQVTAMALYVSMGMAFSQALALLLEGTLHISRYRISLAILCPAFIARRAYRRRSLDRCGSIAGCFIGAVLTLHSYCHIVALITFFVSSTTLTKFRRDVKGRFDAEARKVQPRTWCQVVANGGPAMLLALLAFIGQASDVLGWERRLVVINETGDIERMLWYDLTILGSIAAAAGDTWASEIGAAVGTGEPRLITTLKKVPRGTNGAISPLGTLASVAGGTAVGVAYWITLLMTTEDPGVRTGGISLPQWIVIPVCALCGSAGSTLDSFLGATCQYSGYDTKKECIVEKPGPDVRCIAGRQWLDNCEVNLLTCLLTGLMTPGIANVFM